MITVVTGMGRSGTTLMMKILHKSGINPYCDNFSSYETDKSILLPTQHRWLENCEGKVLKILDPHIHTPPPNHVYSFIWMKRDLIEQAKSQKKFLKACFPNMPFGSGWVKRCAKLNMKIQKQCLDILRQFNDNTLIVDFKDLLISPSDIILKVHEYLNIDKSAVSLPNLINIVDKRNYKCLSYLKEALP